MHLPYFCRKGNAGKLIQTLFQIPTRGIFSGSRSVLPLRLEAHEFCQ